MCLLLDPGKFSTADGKTYGSSIIDVAPKIPSGWSVLQNWQISGTDEDPDGWSYGRGFACRDWYPNFQINLYVRRRPHYRVLAKNVFQESFKLKAVNDLILYKSPSLNPEEIYVIASDATKEDAEAKK